MNSKQFVTLVALFSGSFTAQAQFAVNWSTFDSGGGALSGGDYSLNGTIGQPHASSMMNGGSFSVIGGFWSGVSVEPTPALAIRLGTPMAGVNTVILSWPNPSSSFVLQQTANMNGPGGGWTDVTQSPVIVGPNKEVTLPATGQFCMFRLRN